jgi:hypothetical protein
MATGVRKVWAIVLIVAGLILMPVPILPGIPVVLAGLALLDNNHRVIRAIRGWFEKRKAGQARRDTNSG